MRTIDTVALIGLGVTGSPIAHKMENYYGDDFCLVASEEIKEDLRESKYHINGEQFSPIIASCKDELEKPIDLLIVCVKNYHLDAAVEDIARCIDKNTIIMPLQNGIFSYQFFKKTFPNNQILEGYVQGPNTQIRNNNITYVNPGVVHIGSSNHSELAKEVWRIFTKVGVPAEYEENIRHMIWKKWMLNVAGNSVTALTEADYNMFREIDGLASICRRTMEEFVNIAHSEGIDLSESDIDDVIFYYMTYRGSKKTSMLEDFMNRRKTENDYLAGYALKIAEKNEIDAPMIKTVYELIDIKEKIYLSY